MNEVQIQEIVNQLSNAYNELEKVKQLLLEIGKQISEQMK